MTVAMPGLMVMQAAAREPERIESIVALSACVVGLPRLTRHTFVSSIAPHLWKSGSGYPIPTARRGVLMNRALAMLAVLLFPLIGAAQEIGTFTLAEGSPRLIRGATVLRVSEGVRVQNGDILETSAPGFVQAEFANGSIVAIGPSTRVLIHSAASKSADVILMSGWLKGETASGAAGYRFSSSLLSATAKAGTVILHAEPADVGLYVESGTATVNEAGGHPIAAKAGQFFTRHGAKFAVTSRPDGPFLESMPQPFRDTLPSRESHFAGKKPIEPKHDHDVTYAEAEPWLKMGAWRKSFEERFQPRLKDAEFRKAVESHIAEYPEWNRILHPEKYPQDSPSAPADNSKPPSGRY